MLKHPEHVIAVDPGIDLCGVAAFVDKHLVACAHIGGRLGPKVDPLIRAAATAEVVFEGVKGWHLAAVSHLIVEWPQIYMPGKSKVPGGDILLLAAVAGAIAMIFAPLKVIRTTTTPAGWKGQLHDRVVQARVRTRLDKAGELEILQSALDALPESRQHNVTDAVGIGLSAIGRSIRGD
jgi:hypothetical protein